MAGKNKFQKILNGGKISRGFVWGMLILTALFAFELFNYSTTDFAMTDLLGDLRFAGVRWATILAIAFCGIDFAGIARLFTPEEGASEPNEVWYLFGAWLLAATMNAILTWWGVSIAILSNTSLGNAVIPRETMLKVVPIFVAVMIWLIRILIIGTFSVAGERLFTQGDNKPLKPRTRKAPARRTQNRPATQTSFSPVASKGHTIAEPTYHPTSMQAQSSQAQASNSGNHVRG